jgi:hypothetical protein
MAGGEKVDGGSGTLVVSEFGPTPRSRAEPVLCCWWQSSWLWESLYEVGSWLVVGCRFTGCDWKSDEVCGHGFAWRDECVDVWSEVVTVNE